MSRTRLLMIALIASLGACVDAGAPSGAGGAMLPEDDGASAEARSLCVSSACGEVIELVAIPDAENIHLSPDGRLFVTGGSNVYEVVQTGELAFEARPLSAETCGFTGMAQKDDYLYVVCGDGRIFGAALDADPQVVPIFAMDGMCIANGTALGPDGHLYVIDEPLDPSCLPPNPQIARLIIDPADPGLILAQETWVQGSPTGLLPFGGDTTMRFPNGLAVDGTRFWATDGGSVFYVDLMPDGSAGPVTPVFFEPTAHDDLSVAEGSLLVTDFFNGRIFQLSFDGVILQETDPLTFDSPSAVQLARPPMFRSDDILVTEKGLLLEQNLPTDVLSLFRRVD